MWIALAKPWAWGEHLISQLTWAAACWQLAIRIFPVNLVDEFNSCVLWPLMIELMVVLFNAFLDGEYGFTSIGSWCCSREWVLVILFDIFLDGEYGFTSIESWCYRGWGWNLRTKVCFIASAQESEVSAGHPDYFVEFQGKFTKHWRLLPC